MRYYIPWVAPQIVNTNVDCNNDTLFRQNISVRVTRYCEKYRPIKALAERSRENF